MTPCERIARLRAETEASEARRAKLNAHESCVWECVDAPAPRVLDVVALFAELDRLRAAAAIAEPWAHTTFGGTAAMHSGIAQASLVPGACSVRHSDPCPGCALRKELVSS